MSTDAVDRVNVHWIYIFLLYSYCTVQQEKSRLTTCTYCHGYSYVFYGLYKVISIYNRHRLLSCIIAMCDAFWPKWGLAEGLALLKKVGKTKFKNYSIWQRETYRLTLKTSLGSSGNSAKTWIWGISFQPIFLASKQCFEILFRSDVLGSSKKTKLQLKTIKFKRSLN